jgi:hypothetical protein
MLTRSRTRQGTSRYATGVPQKDTMPYTAARGFVPRKVLPCKTKHLRSLSESASRSSSIFISASICAFCRRSSALPASAALTFFTACSSLSCRCLTCRGCRNVSSQKNEICIYGSLLLPQHLCWQQEELHWGRTHVHQCSNGSSWAPKAAAFGPPIQEPCPSGAPPEQC